MSAEVDFANEVERLVGDPLVGPGEVSIWGGEVDASRLRSFLDVWKLSSMPYRLWEYTHRITFVETELREADLLERVRLFGDGGDLSLRRDGERFVWHFIGAPSTLAPAGIEPLDFWTENSAVRLRRTEEKALLWGEHDGRDDDDNECWQEDRVGWARLAYPCQPFQRVRIVYDVFTDHGQVAFVWWKQLEELSHAQG